MVKGIDEFRKYFSGYEDRYVIIGGAACDLLFENAGLDFRATKDIDMVLCVEVVDAEFGGKFKSFLDAGGYQARERSDGKRQFFRFHKPTDENFPYMIELFSRKPDTLKGLDGATIAPVLVEDEALSLSALLLDEAYYQEIESKKKTINDLPILDETLLIPFKAKAYLNLKESKERGEEVDSKTIKKHRSDVFRLAQLLRQDAKINLPKAIADDLRTFLTEVESDGTFDPPKEVNPQPKADTIALIRSVYELG